MDLEYLKNKKILLVDDEPDLLAMVEEILEKEGYRNIRRAGCTATLTMRAPQSAANIC